MIHGYWLKKYGIAGSYEAIDVAPEDAAGFFATLKATRLCRRQRDDPAQGGGVRGG